MSAKSKSKSTRKSTVSPRIIWFDVPVDDFKRAGKFYGSLFGWKIAPLPNMPDYWHIDTGGGDDTPDGGLMKRKCPEHPVTNYVHVESVAKASAKVEKLGGKVHMAKTAVPNMGYFAICQDTENNTFAIWETNGSAK
jgi:predicted enzyme related to lactoylglutathione lyase